jgi:putative tricarboxylic transport membrane protein
MSGTVLIVVAVAYGAIALRIPGGEGEPGPGFLPLVLAALLGAVSLGIVLSGLKKESREPVKSALGARPWLAALATVAYAALFQPVGFTLSTLAYVAAVTRLFTHDRRVLVAVPIVVTLALFSFFRLALGVRLPPWPLS